MQYDSWREKGFTFAALLPWPDCQRLLNIVAFQKTFDDIFSAVDSSSQYFLFIFDATKVSFDHGWNEFYPPCCFVGRHFDINVNHRAYLCLCTSPSPPPPPLPFPQFMNRTQHCDVGAKEYLEGEAGEKAFNA